MRFLCLCPTYGRRPELVWNAIWCFKQQARDDDAYLCLIDDLGTIDATDAPSDMIVVQTGSRVPTLPQKYLLGFLECSDLDFDAVAIWDDDDLYFPHHLLNHSKALEHGPFSKPSTIYSTYTGTIQPESAAGRFWGSCAMRREVFEANLSKSSKCSYDQESIANFERLGMIDPCLYGPPQYVYRWGETSAAHASGYGSDDWYTNAKPQHRESFRLKAVADVACRRWYPAS
jgi:hypothetical protein